MSSVYAIPDWANAIAGSFFSGATETLAGNKTITAADAMILKLDPAGSARDVVLPAEASIGAHGQMFWIINAADAAENLAVKNDNGDTIGTANQNESVVVYNAGAQDGVESAWVLVAVVAIALS